MTQKSHAPKFHRLHLIWKKAFWWHTLMSTGVGGSRQGKSCARLDDNWSSLMKNENWFLFQTVMFSDGLSNITPQAQAISTKVQKRKTSLQFKRTLHSFFSAALDVSDSYRCEPRVRTCQSLSEVKCCVFVKLAKLSEVNETPNCSKREAGRIHGDISCCEYWYMQMLSSREHWEQELKRRNAHRFEIIVGHQKIKL